MGSTNSQRITDCLDCDDDFVPLFNDKPYRVHLCGGGNCSPHSIPMLLQHLEDTIHQHNLDALVEVYVGGCQGECKSGPNLMIFPGSYRYSNLSAAAITQIVVQHLCHDTPVSELLATATHDT